jgi:hypothetical protein
LPTGKNTNIYLKYRAYLLKGRSLPLISRNIAVTAAGNIATNT